MSAGFEPDVLKENREGTPSRCAVVSIYEDGGGRDFLLRFCGSLAGKFRGILEFQFDWWRFKYLADLELGMKAAQTAAQANLILLAAHSPELPAGVRDWFENCLPHRKEGDAALVLIQAAPKSGFSLVSLESYLHRVARRACLDYFSILQPEVAGLPFDDKPPLHWGINE